MNGEPLPLEHGFPARMVTPGLYGYVSATKWLVDLEVTRFADFKAYWTTRGYAAEAPIKTSLADRRAPLLRPAEGRPERRSPASPGRRTAASRRSRSASTAGTGRRPELAERGRRQHLAPVGLALGRRARQPHPRGPRHRRRPATRRPPSARPSRPTAPPAGTASNVHGLLTRNTPGPTHPPLARDRTPDASRARENSTAPTKGSTRCAPSRSAAIAVAAVSALSA